MDTAIVASGLVKTFKPRSAEPVRAVRGVDVTISRGEIVAILGPNGAGKTTLVDMILGMSKPTSGQVEVFGMRPREAVRKEKSSAVLQTGGLLRDITVRETADIIAAQFSRPMAVSDALERAGITNIAKRRVSKCSGGEQQRLKFALALLADPELLILDEPTAGMDVNARHSFWNAMREETHRTVLFATHYLEEAQAFADRIILMSRGEVIADAPTEEIRSLTSIRTVTFKVPTDREAAGSSSDKETLLADRIRALHAVVSVKAANGRLTVETTDSDSLLTPILEWGGRDIEVAAPTLEAAFMTLTEEA